MTLRETGELIGDCGLTLQNINGELLPEIGYHIRRDCQRQGYAAEAARSCRDLSLIHILLMDLDATPEQLDSPMLFCSGRKGTASYSPDVEGTDLKPLFETILEYICLLYTSCHGAKVVPNAGKYENRFDIITWCQWRQI